MSTRVLRSLVAVIAGVAVMAAPAQAAWAPPIKIPQLGLDQRGSQSLDAGPIVYFHDGDTVAIAGHRTTYGGPFRRLNRLRPGIDKVFVAERAYVVKRVFIVRPWQVWPLNLKGVVLSACTLPNGEPTSLLYRIIVHAVPIES